MSKITASNFYKGLVIEFRNEPSQIVDSQFYNPGKGSAVVRVKLKNLKTGRVLDFTFKSQETAQEISVDTHEMQYLYSQNDLFVFMNPKTYEQISIVSEIIGDFTRMLKEGEVYQIMLIDGQPVGFRKPKKVTLKVVEADESAVKGNTQGGAKKTVILESGLSVAVPLFIKTGDTITVDVDSGEYVERAGQK